MADNQWLEQFFYDELATITVALNRRTIKDVARYLAARIEQRHLALVPSFLSDEMFEAQKNTNPTISYQEASVMYNNVIVDYAKRASQIAKLGSNDDDNY